MLIVNDDGLGFRSFRPSLSIFLDDSQFTFTDLFIRHSCGLTLNLGSSFPEPFFGIKAGDWFDLG